MRSSASPLIGRMESTSRLAWHSPVCSRSGTNSAGVLVCSWSVAFPSSVIIVFWLIIDVINYVFTNVHINFCNCLTTNNSWENIAAPDICFKSGMGSFLIFLLFAYLLVLGFQFRGLSIATLPQTLVFWFAQPLSLIKCNQHPLSVRPSTRKIKLIW